MAQKLVSDALLSVFDKDTGQQDAVLQVALWDTSDNSDIFANSNGRQGNLEITRDELKGPDGISKVAVYIPEDSFETVADLLSVVFKTIVDLQQTRRPKHINLSDLIKMAASFESKPADTIEGTVVPEGGLPSCGPEGECTNQASGGPNDATQGYNFTKDGAQPI